MKTLLMLLMALPTFAQQYTPQPWPQQPWGDAELTRAVAGVQTLRDTMRDPDSFVLESVTLVLGRKGYDVCYAYRARNGYGGMNRGQARLTTHNTVEQGWLMSVCGHTKGTPVPDITTLVNSKLAGKK